MYWSAEESVLAVTGALLLVIVAASFAPSVRLTMTSRLAFAIGAIVLISSAIVLGGLETVRYPLLLWLLPAVPLAVIGMLVRDAIVGRSGASPSPRAMRGTGQSADPLHPVALNSGSRVPVQGDAGAAHMVAADPSAAADELATIAYMHPQLRATVASNPATPASVLEWLAALGDPAVHAAIASRVQAPA